MHGKAMAIIQAYENRGLEFVIDGKAIPEVDFDVGESYAGLLPISNSTTESNNLFFWVSLLPIRNTRRRKKLPFGSTAVYVSFSLPSAEVL